MGDPHGLSSIFVDPEPVLVSVDSVDVVEGTYVAGGVMELAESDNTDLTIRRRTSDLQSRTAFEVEAISPFANPTFLEVTLEGAVFARSPVIQSIEAFDHITNQWEQVYTRLAPQITDSVVAVPICGNASRFVEPETMCLKARVSFQSPVARQRFASNTDQFLWKIWE